MRRDDTAIRALRADDLTAYRRLRLDALSTSPEAFSSTFEEEAAMDDANMLARVVPPDPGLSLGGFSDEELVAMAAYVPNGRMTARHKATMVAVYVAPSHRGTGLGRRLVEAIIAMPRASVCFCIARSRRRMSVRGGSIARSALSPTASSPPRRAAMDDASTRRFWCSICAVAHRR